MQLNFMLDIWLDSHHTDQVTLSVKEISKKWIFGKVKENKRTSILYTLGMGSWYEKMKHLASGDQLGSRSHWLNPICNSCTKIDDNGMNRAERYRYFLGRKIHKLVWHVVYFRCLSFWDCNFFVSFSKEFFPSIKSASSDCWISEKYQMFQNRLNTYYTDYFYIFFHHGFRLKVNITVFDT